jgi:hypothetical protein
LDKLKNILKGIKKAVIRLLIIIPLSILLIFCGALVAIQVPSVQTSLVARATKILSDAINFPVSIEKVNIRWLNTIRLENVRLVDNHGKDMITVQKLDASFRLLSFFNGKNIVIKEAILDSANVNLNLDEKTGDLNMDEFVRRLNRLGGPSTDTTPSKPFPFIIKKVILKNSHFTYFDEEEKEFRKGFDHFHFGFKNIEIEADSFKINKDTIQMNIRHLTGIETSSGLPIHKFTAFYRLTSLDMMASHLDADIGKTHLSDLLIFHYPDLSELSEFLDSVTLDLHLKDTRIHTDDLAEFAPELAKMHQKWTVSGKFYGKVTDFTAKHLNLRFGQSSAIRGNLDIKGLPDFFNTFAEMDLNKSVVYANDLRPFLDNDAFEFMKKLGKVTLTGNFIGFPKDFVYTGNLISELGYLNTDLNLKINGVENTFYEGKIKAKNFNLGKLINQERYVSNIDMDGSLNGTGLNLTNLKLNAEANIQQIQLLGYAYKNVKMNAFLGKNYFSGDLSVKDTNLTMQLSGSVDATVKPEKVSLEGTLDHADLKAIHLLEQGLNISGKCNLDFSGLIQSETEGYLQFSDIVLERDNKTAKLGDLDIRSELVMGQRDINFRSDWLWAQFKGDFLLKTLTDEVSSFVKETILSFKNDSTTNKNYYAKKETPINQYIDFNVNFDNITPIIQLFYPDYSIAKKSHINGSFSSGETYFLFLQGKSDSIVYKGKSAFDNALKISFQKEATKETVVASTSIISKRIDVNPAITLKDFYSDVVWKDERIDFKVGTKQEDYTNSVDFGGFLTLFDLRTDLKITYSDMNILDKHWSISDSNKVSFTPNSVFFQSFSLNEGKQRIRLDGTLSNNPSDPLHISINNFNLVTLNSLITYKLKGILNGDITVKDLYNNLTLDNKLYCDSLYVNNFLFGNVTAVSSWDNFLQKIQIRADLERGGKFVASLAGHYDPKEKVNPLNLNVTLNKANISVVEPFISDILSSLKGEASGILDIDGSFEKLLITGTIHIDNGKMRVNYLNTVYSFSDNFYFEKDFFGFKNCEITDEGSQKGTLNGGIYHNYYRDMRLNFEGKVNKFQVLNTTEKDNDIFYGTGIVSGTFSLKGPFNNILITAAVKTEDGTRMFLPLNQKESVSRQDYITFVTKRQKDSLSTKSTKGIISKPDSSRIRIDFDIEMTKSAYCEIIFDKKSGDIIRGYGSGLLRMDMDTKGGFTMSGDYTISQGAYNFTMLNIINKGFTIKPGSRISWTGDPVNANLDIVASYTQNVLLTPILPLDTSAFKSNSAFSRRYPAVINLNLRGNLLKPDISYGLEIKDYPTTIGTYPVDIYVKAFLASLVSNEQEMNKQVFSLLVLKSFLSSTDSRFTNLSQSAFGSVSELISNQLNNWLSQVDQNLQIDIDLNGLDKNALNAMRMRLSYSLLKGRLRIMRDGGFANTTNQSNTYTVLGEWTVEYLLTKDGILRLKMFNKNNPNAGVTALDANSNGFAGGFSLLHTQSFDNLNDLFRKKEKEEEKKKQKELEKLNQDAILNKEKEEQPNIP